MGECGHAFRTGIYEGVRFLGWKESPIPYIHGVQFSMNFHGRQDKIAKKIEEPVTVQDPCNIVRYRGMGDMIRYIIRQTCENFIDINPGYEYNYCLFCWWRYG